MKEYFIELGVSFLQVAILLGGILITRFFVGNMWVSAPGGFGF